MKWRGCGHGRWLARRGDLFDGGCGESGGEGGPHAGGVSGEVQAHGEGGEGVLFEEAEEQYRAVGLAEFVECGVEERAESVPIGGR